VIGATQHAPRTSALSPAPTSLVVLEQMEQALQLLDVEESGDRRRQIEAPFLERPIGKETGMEMTGQGAGSSQGTQHRCQRPLVPTSGGHAHHDGQSMGMGRFRRE